MPEQNYQNHKRTVAGFHIVAFGLAGIGLVWAIREAVRERSLDAVIDVGMVVAVALALFYARIFALAAQNRVIRLEEQLRMARVLPDELRGRVGELRMSHFIALRFAPDDELAGLVQRVLAGDLTDQDAIKRAIRTWRPDYTRV